MRIICCVLAVTLLSGMPSVAQGPHMATGIKVGEVTDTSALVWTRLTLRPGRNPDKGPMVTIQYGKRARGKGRQVESIVYPGDATVADIQGAVPGAPGRVRVRWRPVGAKEWEETNWMAVDPRADFTRQFRFEGLQPKTRYELIVEAAPAGQDTISASLNGAFRTAPSPTEPSRVVFTVSTGQRYRARDHAGGYAIYPRMLQLDPDFFVHTGDIVYYDDLAKNIDLARYHWQRTYSLPNTVDFHRQVASCFIKDDHDTWLNDCWPAMKSGHMGSFTFAQGVATFLEQVPMGERTWRTRRWGRDLQIWMVEGRDFRSPNNMKDGPEKTIWGAEQMAWFRKTVAASDATFRILISPTPVVGPDRNNKRDNHSNKNFAHEGDELRTFIASQENMVVVCGDRHWQYHSIHPESGVKEYSCGPASDKHAGGWKKTDFRKEYHRYLNVIGGFLSVTVERANNVSRASFRFHDVKGAVRFEDVIEAGVR